MKKRITDLLGKKIIVCDGAMGTMLQKYGLKAGELPELLSFTQPEIIKDIYRKYLQAGSDFVSANTFGCNRFKLANSGYTVEQVVTQAVKLAREAAGEFDKFAALDLGPLGKLMEPSGDLSFDVAYDVYKEIILAGAEAGADFVLFETFLDIYEMKAAVLAAKENCDLPVFCSVTFQPNGRMLMGADPHTVVNILQDMGVDALGMNCSLGPKDMIGIAKEFLAYSKLPVLVQPNAGLPELVDGETVYNVGVSEYAEAMREMLRAGVAVAGGCCGANPDYIAALAAIIDEENYPALSPDADKNRKAKAMTAVSSATKTVVFDGRIRVVGERLNPTGKKLLKEALKAKNFSYIRKEAMNQVKAGADILDLNVGLPDIDELEMMLEIMKKISNVSAPLQIDSADPRVIEAAARYYNGKPIINSVNGKKESMEAIFPIVKKYGACVIALTLDERGLPKNAEERLEIAERIIKTAESYGIGRERIFVDCLTLTVSAQQSAGLDTLEAIRMIKKRFGVKTVLGVSNVSFGLPERKLLNRTFLAMALEAGLDAPITDPLVPEYWEVIHAYEALAYKDIDSVDYIRIYGGQAADSDAPKGPEKLNTAADPQELTLEKIIIEGYGSKAAAAAEALLKTMSPLEIIEQKIIPALETVGKEYESGASFLPQLIKSADTVKSAFAVLNEAMKASGGMVSYGKIILATVEGDIHDIGKNIVKALLENYGYEIIDLGKDVPVEKVVEAAKSRNIKMVGLSALMTTTVESMERTIKALKAAGLDCVTAVGGAVLTEDYAEKIGADFYCRDAMDTVKVANRLFKGE